jgi:hypothetical protein
MAIRELTMKTAKFFAISNLISNDFSSRFCVCSTVHSSAEGIVCRINHKNAKIISFLFGELKQNHS